MKKYILGILLLGALAGCNDNKYLAVKEWEAPTHKNEARITYELFVRKAIEFATPEDDVLEKKDIQWSVIRNNNYDASVVASYGSLYKVYINMNDNAVKNIELVHDDTSQPLEDVIRNRKVQVLKDMRIPESEFIDYLAFSQNKPAKNVSGMCEVILQFPQVKPIRTEDIVYKFIAETKEGFIMRAFHAGDYVEISVKYDGQMLKYSSEDIVVYYNDYGHIVSLPDLDRGLNI